MDVERKKGWFHVFGLSVSQIQVNETAYIYDCGDMERNRLSLFIAEGRIKIRYLDDEGQATLLDAGIANRSPFPLRIECAPNDPGKFVNVWVDNVQHEFIISRNKMELYLNCRNYVVGADLSKLNGGMFRLISFYYGNITPSQIDRLGSFHYYRRNLNKTENTLEFSDSSFMTPSPMGGLVADIGHQPILVRGIGY